MGSTTEFGIKTAARAIMDKIANCDIKIKGPCYDKRYSFTTRTKARPEASEQNPDELEQKNELLFSLLTRKDKLLKAYDKLLKGSISTKISLNRANLPGYVFLAKRIYADASLWTVIDYLIDDESMYPVKEIKKDEKKKYKTAKVKKRLSEKEYRYRKYGNNKTPVTVYLSDLYSDVRFTTRADALYKGYLVGTLQALNASIAPLLQTCNKSDDRNIITANVQLCLDKIAEYEEQESGCLNSAIETSELLSKIIKIKAYTDAATVLTGIKPTDYNREEIAEATGCIDEFMKKCKSLQLYLNKVNKKTRNINCKPAAKKKE